MYKYTGFWRLLSLKSDEKFLDQYTFTAEGTI